MRSLTLMRIVTTYEKQQPSESVPMTSQITAGRPVLCVLFIVHSIPHIPNNI